MIGGLENFSPDDERAALHDGPELNMGFSAKSEDFRLSAAGESSRLLLALQDLAARFTHPAFREEDWPRAQEIIRQQLAPYEKTASGMAQVMMVYRISGSLPALASPTGEEAGRRTLGEFKDWFTPQLASAPIEIALVGDFEPAAAIEAVARTFGTLRARVSGDPYAAQRRIKFPPARFSDAITFDGNKGVATVVLAWPAPETVTFAERLNGVLLADILEDRLRLKLRAEMGETYSPGAMFSWNDAFTPSPTYLACSIETAPEHTALVAAAARNVAETLAREGATAEEFERARRPLVRQTDESSVRDNGWWLDTLAVAQSQPAYAYGWLRASASYQAVTVGEVNELARKLLVGERLCQLTVTPPSADVETYTNRGGGKFNRGNFAGALADFNKVVELDPTSAVAYNNRGSARNGLGDQAGARADYDKAIALDSRYATAYDNRAQLKEAAGDHAGAIADYDHAITLVPDNPDFYRNRAKTKKAQGDLAGASSDEATAAQLRLKIEGTGKPTKK